LRTKFTTNYFGNPRPYWNKDFDAGIYEIEDTQLKVGTYNINNTNISMDHYLTSYGTYWTRTSNGSYNILNNTGYQSANVTSTGNFNELNLHAFPGFQYPWLQQNSNSLPKLAAGFYKLKSVGNGATDSIYIDLRDAVEMYSLNLYIRYNFSAVVGPNMSIIKMEFLRVTLSLLVQY
jgi:hypothetical protein